jgi:serine/threonine-protein kinase
MEYLEGSDLGALLEERGRLHYMLAVDYVLQACEAIAEAHAMKTVHRDLKPSNLFLVRLQDGQSLVKVLDFGISKLHTAEHAAQMTQTREVMGSPAYMSPEQLKSARSVDARADIWSLGIILYELISGSLPFSAPSLAELSVQILVAEPPWLSRTLPEVPEALSRVVATCLHKQVGKRFVDLADFANAVAPFGSAGAARSAERITKALGMPSVRAILVVAPSPEKAPTDALAVTQAVSPAQANAITTRPSSQANTGLKLAIGAVLLMTVGMTGATIAIWRRPDVPLASTVTGSGSTTIASATASASTPGPLTLASTAEPLPPPTGSAEPAASAVTSAPSASSAGLKPHGAVRAAATGVAAAPRPTASAAPTPPPTSPPTIATSSKD